MIVCVVNLPVIRVNDSFGTTAFGVECINITFVVSSAGNNRENFFVVAKIISANTFAWGVRF